VTRLKPRTLGERLHGLRGVAVRVLGRPCGSRRAGVARILDLTCDKRAGHSDGQCEDRAWIGGWR
jgi:hypothetical protein